MKKETAHTNRDLISEIREALPLMEKQQRKEAIELLQSIVYENMYRIAAEQAEYDVECCPRCGCVSIVKKGKNPKDGSQRYYCKGCGKTFGASTNKVLGTSKLPAETWLLYIECFIDRLTLRECAERCGVCLKTSFLMRHRLIECLGAFCPSFQVEAGCGAELDETFFPESFKGNHAKGDFALPRKAHKRGKQVRKRGLSKEQICVMTGVNDSGDMFYDLAGRGMLDSRRAMSVLENRIEDGALVSTDKAKAYPSVLRELGVAAHEAFDANDRSEGNINHVNALHSSIKRFMRRFNGVATKYLAGYLAWFKWQGVYDSADGDALRIAVRQMESGTCRTRVRSMWGTEPPYMDYWLDNAA